LPGVETGRLQEKVEKKAVGENLSNDERKTQHKSRISEGQQLPAKPKKLGQGSGDRFGLTRGEQRRESLDRGLGEMRPATPEEDLHAGGKNAVELDVGV